MIAACSILRIGLENQKGQTQLKFTSVDVSNESDPFDPFDRRTPKEVVAVDPATSFRLGGPGILYPLEKRVTVSKASCVGL